MSPPPDSSEGVGPLHPSDLRGSWLLSRRIEDRRAGERHELDGTLIVADDGRRLSRLPGLLWQEALTWQRPEGAVAMSRRLRLVQEREGWWVRFEDDRPFHRWSPGSRVVHPCGPDTYVGTVAGDLTRWTITWEVSGPGKDYTMRSVLLPGGPD